MNQYLPPPLIPPEAKRPRAKAIIKDVLAKRGMSVERFFGPEKDATINLQIFRVKVEIIERLYKELHYPPMLIGKIVKLHDSTVRYHLIKMGARQPYATAS